MSLFYLLIGVTLMQVKVFKIIVVELEPVKTGPALQDFELPLFLVCIVLYTSIF